jgi:putative transposase
MAYSKDLRVRLIGSVEQGRSARSQAKVFQVSASTAVKWMAAFRSEGLAEPKPHRGGRRSALDGHGEWLKARVAEKSDITLKELSAELGARGIAASKSAVSRFFERIGFSFKKKRAGLRAGSSRHSGRAASLARRAALARSKQAGVHR